LGWILNQQYFRENLKLGPGGETGPANDMLRNLRDSGDRDGAERELRAALASFAAYLPNAEHPLAATTRLALSRLLAIRPENQDEAVRLASEAVSIRERFLDVDDERTHAARAELAALKSTTSVGSANHQTSSHPL
jgi:hypothetical protein